LLCIGSTSAHSEEDLTIEVRTIGILPYGIESNNGSSGIYYDIANRLIELAGYNSHNFISPYVRIMLELKSGETDMTIMFKYKELEDFVNYIAPLPVLETVVIGLKGVTFASVKALEGKSLAYLRGAKFSDAIDRNPDIINIETIDFLQAMKLLLVKRVDAIIGPMDPILVAASRISPDKQVLGQPLIVDQRTPWIQISKKSSERLSAKRLKQSFDIMKNNGEFDAFRRKYITP